MIRKLTISLQSNDLKSLETDLKTLARRTSDFTHGNVAVDLEGNKLILEIYPDDILDPTHTRSVLMNMFAQIIGECI